MNGGCVSSPILDVDDDGVPFVASYHFPRKLPVQGQHRPENTIGVGHNVLDGPMVFPDLRWGGKVPVCVEDVV